IVYLRSLQDNSAHEFPFEIGYILPGQTVDSTYNYYSKLDAVSKNNPDTIKKFNCVIRYKKASEIKTLEKMDDGNFTILNLEYKSSPRIICLNYEPYIDSVLWKKVEETRALYKKMQDSIILQRKTDSLEKRSRK